MGEALGGSPLSDSRFGSRDDREKMNKLSPRPSIFKEDLPRTRDSDEAFDAVGRGNNPRSNFDDVPLDENNHSKGLPPHPPTSDHSPATPYLENRGEPGSPREGRSHWYREPVSAADREDVLQEDPHHQTDQSSHPNLRTKLSRHANSARARRYKRAFIKRPWMTPLIVVVVAVVIILFILFLIKFIPWVVHLLNLKSYLDSKLAALDEWKGKMDDFKDEVVGKFGAWLSDGKQLADNVKEQVKEKMNGGIDKINEAVVKIPGVKTKIEHVDRRDLTCEQLEALQPVQRGMLAVRRALSLRRRQEYNDDPYLDKPGGNKRDSCDYLRQFWGSPPGIVVGREESSSETKPVVDLKPLAGGNLPAVPTTSVHHHIGIGVAGRDACDGSETLGPSPPGSGERRSKRCGRRRAPEGSIPGEVELDGRDAATTSATVTSGVVTATMAATTMTTTTATTAAATTAVATAATVSATSAGNSSSNSTIHLSSNSTSNSTVHLSSNSTSNSTLTLNSTLTSNLNWSAISMVPEKNGAMSRRGSIPLPFLLLGRLANLARGEETSSSATGETRTATLEPQVTPTSVVTSARSGHMATVWDYPTARVHARAPKDNKKGTGGHADEEDNSTSLALGRRDYIPYPVYILGHLFRFARAKDGKRSESCSSTTTLARRLCATPMIACPSTPENKGIPSTAASLPFANANGVARTWGIYEPYPMSPGDVSNTNASATMNTDQSSFNGESGVQNVESRNKGLAERVRDTCTGCRPQGLGFFQRVYGAAAILKDVGRVKAMGM